MSSIGALYPPGSSPEERLANRLASMERRLTDATGGLRQGYAEQLAAQTSTAAVPASVPQLDFFVHTPQFVDYMGMCEMSYPTANTAAYSFIIPILWNVDTNTLIGAGNPLQVTKSDLGYTEVYSYPGAVGEPDEALAIIGRGGWCTFWVSAPGTYRVAMWSSPGNFGGLPTDFMSIRNQRLWVRY